MNEKYNIPEIHSLDSMEGVPENENSIKNIEEFSYELLKNKKTLAKDVLSEMFKSFEYSEEKQDMYLQLLNDETYFQDSEDGIEISRLKSLSPRSLEKMLSVFLEFAQKLQLLYAHIDSDFYSKEKNEHGIYEKRGPAIFLAQELIGNAIINFFGIYQIMKDIKNSNLSIDEKKSILEKFKKDIEDFNIEMNKYREEGKKEETEGYDFILARVVTHNVNTFLGRQVYPLINYLESSIK